MVQVHDAAEAVLVDELERQCGHPTAARGCRRRG
jgi:hypothetical protein